MVMKNNKPWLHVDLDEMPIHLVVSYVRAWILIDRIEIQIIAGPRTAKTKAFMAGFFELSKVSTITFFKVRRVLKYVLPNTIR